MSRIRADKISNKAGTGAVQLQYGAEVPVGYGITGAGTINVTGVITAASFAGSGANLTGIDATSIKDSGGNVKIQAQSSGAMYTGIHTFLGNVSVGGTLTYEDVTNVDSVGLITARNGINISDTTQSSSTTTGALKVAGGVGIAKNLYVAGQLHLPEGAEFRMGTSSNLEIVSVSGNKARIQSQQEDLYIETSGSKSIFLKTNRNGTYQGWSINVDGDLIPSADSTVDIGTNAVRVQNFYADTLYGDGSNLTGISAGVPGISTTGLSGFNHVNVGGAMTCTGTIVNKIDATTENSVIIGEEASANNTNTDYCVIIGKRAGYQNATGKSHNTFMGYQAGYAGGGNVSSYNTMVGSGAGLFMYGDAQYNAAIGYNAGYYNAKNYCVSVGAESGSSRGEYNVAVGAYSQGKGNQMSSSWMTYSGNTGSNQWGDNNICIGYQANTPHDNASNYIVIGNAQHTNLVVGRLGFEITAGVTTNTGSFVVGAGVSAVGIVTASGGLSVGPGVLAEKFHNDTGGGISGTYYHDILTHGMVLHQSTASAGTWTFVVRGNSSTTLNSLMAIGETTTMTLYTPSNNAANYMTTFKVDSSTITPKWAGGTAPSAATGSGTDVYSMTIMKTANATFTVFGNFTNFA
jgi:hypothetical protein